MEHELHAKNGIYWITPRIAQGGFLLDRHHPFLRDGGVTHLLNLDQPIFGQGQPEHLDFAQLIHLPIVDGRRIPDEKAVQILDQIHQIVMTESAKVYVFCNAGINRSPTVLWLYFIACGMGFEEAAERIVRRSPHAVPGHHALVNRSLVDLVLLHGKDKDYARSRLNELDK